MSNEKQFKIKTLYLATRGVQEYRQTIEKYIKSSDRVLEVGCEWGTTSKLIYDRCQNLVATDVSLECVKRASVKNPQIDFRVLDVFNIKEVMSYQIDFNKIYIDVSGFSGYRSFLDVVSLLNMYSSVLNLEIIVIKSGALKQFSYRCKAWEYKKG